MNKHLKSLLIVIPVSFLITGVAVMSFLLDPQFKHDAYYLISLAVCSVWAFFIVPAFPFALCWAKNYFGNLNLEQSFRFGYYAGCGWGVLAVILFLMGAPVIGTIWFIQTFESLIISTKNKNDTLSEDNEIFDL